MDRFGVVFRASPVSLFTFDFFLISQVIVSLPIHTTCSMPMAEKLYETSEKHLIIAIPLAVSVHMNLKVWCHMELLCCRQCLPKN